MRPVEIDEVYIARLSNAKFAVVDFESGGVTQKRCLEMCIRIPEFLLGSAWQILAVVRP